MGLKIISGFTFSKWTEICIFVLLTSTIHLLKVTVLRRNMTQMGCPYTDYLSFSLQLQLGRLAASYNKELLNFHK